MFVIKYYFINIIFSYSYFYKLYYIEERNIFIPIISSRIIDIVSLDSMISLKLTQKSGENYTDNDPNNCRFLKIEIVDQCL